MVARVCRDWHYVFSTHAHTHTHSHTHSAIQFASVHQTNNNTNSTMKRHSQVFSAPLPSSDLLFGDASLTQVPSAKLTRSLECRHTCRRLLAIRVGSFQIITKATLTKGS